MNRNSHFAQLLVAEMQLSPEYIMYALFVLKCIAFDGLHLKVSL